MNEQTLDRRVRRTRTQLRQQLLLLMQEKPVQQITVKELCDRCDINRGTFYLHYKDVQALLASIETELMEQLEQMLDSLDPHTMRFSSKSVPSPELCSVFEFIADNADVVRVLLCDGQDSAFLAQVMDVIRQRVLPIWSNEFSQKGASAEYVYEFVVSGCIGMLQHWLKSDMALSPAALAAMIEHMLGSGLNPQTI